MKFNLPQSIRWRIQVWHGALLLLVLVGFSAVIYRIQRISEFRRLDNDLQFRLTSVLGAGNRPPPPGNRRPPPPPPGEDDWRRPPRPEDGPPDGPPDGSGDRPPSPFQDFRLPADLRPLFGAGEGRPDFYYAIWDDSGALLAKSENAPENIVQPPSTPASAFWTRRNFRETWRNTPPGACVLVGAFLGPIHHNNTVFLGWLVALSGVILALGFLGGRWIALKAIAPIGEISAAAARIASGHLEERINIAETESELGQLAAVLNDTFARLDASFAEQARFTSDAAHELRTPLAIILAQTQFALARPRSPEEYRETISMTQRAAHRMNSLSESLLTLALLDARHANLRPQPCDLADLARDHLEMTLPLADTQGIALSGDLAPAPCEGDPERLSQILTNLLSNALKYAGAGAEIRLASRCENGHALLSVTDTGPGIPAEHLPHLFERFYRVDASRNRTTGGAGLGLAICKSIAEAHGGDLGVESSPGQGACFTLRIPNETEKGRTE